MAPTVLRQLVMVVGYYVVVFGALAYWTFRDYAATRRAPGVAAADAFLMRITLMLGAAAAIGAFVTLRTFLVPLPAIWILAAIAVGDGLLTCSGVQLLVRSWGRMTGTDALAELRAGSTAESGIRYADPSDDAIG